MPCLGMGEAIWFMRGKSLGPTRDMVAGKKRTCFFGHGFAFTTEIVRADIGCSPHGTSQATVLLDATGFGPPGSSTVQALASLQKAAPRLGAGMEKCASGSHERKKAAERLDCRKNIVTIPA